MQSQHQRRSQRAFTLIELMIVVALIGVLASLAVPSFRNYQMKSKRAEAFGNLATLAQTQKAYFAEFSSFVAAAPEPGATSGEVPSNVKRSVAPLSAAFSSLGWTPEGDVFFDYDTSVPGFGDCSCTVCFTATAYGNLDVAGGMSEITFFHPDATGGFCTVGVSGHGPPADPVTSDVIWDSPVRHPSSDFF
ncbi:MAG: prepilin-type N-terminal cleavage/methylation domain-containing protein [Myxococcota bacterium]